MLVEHNQHAVNWKISMYIMTSNETAGFFFSKMPMSAYLHGC